MESLRQKQVASLIQQEMSLVFQTHGRAIFGNVLVTITKTYVTPDLLVARTYVSVFAEDNKQKYIDILNENKKLFTKSIAPKIRNKVRRIPTFEFFLDDSLDNVFKLEAVFKSIKKED